MEINPVIPAPVSAAERSRTTLAADFDNFLTLLTTQLQHQDPLDPLDSNEFVAQLVSFTGVEQAVKSNANLEALINLFKLSQSASAIEYLAAPPSRPRATPPCWQTARRYTSTACPKRPPRRAS